MTCLKSILSNNFHRREGCRRPEDVKIRISRSSARRGNLLGVGKRYPRMTSKQSIQFFHTLLIKKYASNMQYIWLVVCGLFLTVKFSCLFTAVAVLACLCSLLSITCRQLQPKVQNPIDSCADRKHRQEQQRKHFDKNPKSLAPVAAGERVRIREPDGRWKPGTVVRKEGRPRSFFLHTDEGRSKYR